MSDWDDALYDGLKALAEATFPKRCANCGRVFENTDQFLAETERVRGHSGLKQVQDDDAVFLELYRNCPCGSTLMDVFSDRRDITTRGAERRERFDRAMALLVTKGIPADIARRELRKVLKGEKSEIIDALRGGG